MKHTAVLLAATFALAVAASTPAQPQQHAQAPVAHASPRLAATQAAMRDLWLGHVFWVRDVAAARLAGNAEKAKSAEQQVVANAQAIAGAIEPFYGKGASQRLFTLLAGHWGAISGYLDATRAGNKTGQEAALKSLTDNAGEIAAFLSGANPHLPAEALRGLLTAHGGHHVQQIQQLQARQYAQEAHTWTAMKDHMYVIADALAGGIARQFPEKF